MKVELVERVAGLAGDVGKLAVGRAALPSGSSHVLAWVRELRGATCIDECCSNGLFSPNPLTQRDPLGHFSQKSSQFFKTAAFLWEWILG